MQVPARSSPAMTRPAVLCIALLSGGFHANAGEAKSIACAYAKDQALSFDVPKKPDGLPPIEFDYPSKVTLFSFRDDNLLLVAMDEADSTRLRLAISAQRDKAKGVYAGQIVTDLGGNQLMLDNGPVTCRLKG